MLNCRRSASRGPPSSCSHPRINPFPERTVVSTAFAPDVPLAPWPPAGINLAARAPRTTKDVGDRGQGDVFPATHDAGPDDVPRLVDLLNRPLAPWTAVELKTHGRLRVARCPGRTESWKVSGGLPPDRWPQVADGARPATETGLDRTMPPGVSSGGALLEQLPGSHS